MSYTSLEDLYKHLDPATVNSRVVRRGIYDILEECLYNANGKAFTFSTIKNNIENFYKGNTISEEEKKELQDNFHGIGDQKIFGEDPYWGTEYKPTKHIINSAVKDNVPSKLSVFSIRGPSITPAKRGAKQIDFFLNYTPPIVSSQMVPYLDVKFKTKDTSKENITTPSLIRFLLGSGPTSNLSKYDKIIQTSDTFKNSEVVDKESSLFGMEMFLMPQTLTNMDALGESRSKLTRLVKVKPFLPFASIEGFDVTVQNAGAGAFAHKKANLKLKIHDKARLAEIAEFIRGSSGFSKVTIETTYGWSAPSNRRDEDEYSRFINENMRVTEFWQTSNTQFSFDGSGQVSLNIEMVSQAGKILRNATIAGADTGIEKFYNAIKTIDSVKKILSGEKDKIFSITATTEKFFNAASTTGIFADLNKDQVRKAVAELMAVAASSGKLDADTKSDFDKSLEFIEKNDWDSIKKDIVSFITEKFKKLPSLDEKSDPFLPRKVKDYFPDELIALINDRKNSRVNKIPSGTTKKEDLSLSVNGIASFGKVFLDFVLPQIDKEMCDEVQIFFYGLNDECGYSSGCSIAEFPIDLNVLANAYALKTKELGTKNLQIEVLLSIIYDTHFTDMRSIGFGMNKFYKPWDPAKNGNPELDESKNSERMQFLQDYGDISFPIIETFTEMVETVENSKTVKIKRIHIYDKKNSPYSLEQKILDSGDGVYTVGNLDKGALRRSKKVLSQFFSLEQKSLDELKKFLEDLDKVNLDPAVRKVADEEKIKLIKSANGYETIKMNERGAIKTFLMKKVPTITIGTNGSLIINASVASKTDNLQGAINLANSSRGESSARATPSADGLSDLYELPLRSVPMQVTLTSLGIPTAQLYQKFFIDFNTGTTIDNLYTCSQIQHSITQGKFTTNWTFIYDNGYGKFAAPPSIKGILSGEIKDKLQSLVDKKKK